MSFRETVALKKPCSEVFLAELPELPSGGGAGHLCHEHGVSQPCERRLPLGPVVRDPCVDILRDCSQGCSPVTEEAYSPDVSIYKLNGWAIGIGLTDLNLQFKRYIWSKESIVPPSTKSVVSEIRAYKGSIIEQPLDNGLYLLDRLNILLRVTAYRLINRRVHQMKQLVDCRPRNPTRQWYR